MVCTHVLHSYSVYSQWSYSPFPALASFLNHHFPFLAIISFHASLSPNSFACGTSSYPFTYFSYPLFYIFQVGHVGRRHGSKIEFLLTDAFYNHWAICSRFISKYSIFNTGLGLTERNADRNRAVWFHYHSVRDFPAAQDEGYGRLSPQIQQGCLNLSFKTSKDPCHHATKIVASQNMPLCTNLDLKDTKKLRSLHLK